VNWNERMLGHKLWRKERSFRQTDFKLSFDLWLQVLTEPKQMNKKKEEQRA
jgi:hypothetical protein